MGADTLYPIKIAHNAAIASFLPAKEGDSAYRLFRRGTEASPGSKSYLTILEECELGRASKTPPRVILCGLFRE
jgi:hypothetical protein